MKRVWLLALILAFTPFAARAQTAQGYLTASGSDCTTAGACVILNIPSTAATGTFTISGTWSATLQFEIAQDGTHFTAVNAFPPDSSTGASSATANGTWTVSVAGMQVFRVRCSAYTSGSALVTANTSQAVSSAALAAAGGGGGGGVASFSGDGALLTNSASTGAVVATVGNAAAHNFWGNNTGTSAAGAYARLACADLSNASASCSADATNATNITSGTLPVGRIPTAIPIASVGSAGLSATAPLSIASTGAISQTPYSGAWFSIQAQLVGNSSALSGANAINITEFDFPATKTFTSIFVEVGTADASGLYSWGICDTSGNILASMASAVHVPSGNTIVFGTVPSTTLQPGHYVFYITGTATTALFGSTGAVFPISSYASRTAVSTSTSGLASSPITFAASTFTKLGSSLVIGFGLQ